MRITIVVLAAISLVAAAPAGTLSLVEKRDPLISKCHMEETGVVCSGGGPPPPKREPLLPHCHLEEGTVVCEGGGPPPP